MVAPLLLLLCLGPSSSLHFEVMRMGGKKIGPPRRRPSPKNTPGSVGLTLERKATVDLPTRIFFTNVRYDVEEDELIRFFQSVGQVTHCKLVRERTGESKGWGFCTYAEPLHASLALRSLAGLKVNGRPIRLGEATSLARRRKEKRVAEGYARREARRQRERDETEGGGGEHNVNVTAAGTAPQPLGAGEEETTPSPQTKKKKWPIFLDDDDEELTEEDHEATYPRVATLDDDDTEQEEGGALDNNEEEVVVGDVWDTATVSDYLTSLNFTVVKPDDGDGSEEGHTDTLP